MKIAFAPAALAIPAMLLAAGALAQGRAPAPVPANQTWCLEVYEFDGSYLLCRFTTEAQCIASRTSRIDLCMLNPVLAFQRRR